MTDLSDTDKEIISLQIEKSRLNREKAKIVLNKSLFLYFGFMAAGVIGFVQGYFDNTILNLLVIVGIIILMIGAIPYLVISHKEEKRINRMLSEFMEEKNE